MYAISPPHESHPAHQPALAGNVVVAGGQAIPPEDLETIERLDDTIFAALEGDAQALDSAAGEWRAANQTIDPSLLDESRRQYERRAKTIWRRYERRPDQGLATGFAALEILGLLEEREAA